MSGISRYLLGLAAVVGVLLLLMGAAQAFFPEATEVADKLKANYEKLHSWQVNLSLNGTSDRVIRSWHKGELWRQEWLVTGSNATQTIRAAVGSGRRIGAIAPASANIPYPPLNLSWLDNPREEWKKLAIAETVKSYQFLENRPCIVLGAEHGDLRSTQVWIDLERHVPLRLIAPSGIIWRWSKYYSLGNHLLPTRLRITFPQGKRFAFDLEWRQVATEIDRSRFDPANITRKFDQVEDLEVDEPELRFLLNSLPPGDGSSLFESSDVVSRD